ncbi:hypothetical protein CZ787_05750 [Halomonas citrativorans]|uniref:Uncharacterized protein n=1 Tax=Halomonas citrativorans TaxID=2742612 RepID=A0A1R4HUY6_9GAMM|nr:hypothetical protein CZ787_05750 [Halomonas citrativorans]
MWKNLTVTHRGFILAGLFNYADTSETDETATSFVPIGARRGVS